MRAALVACLLLGACGPGTSHFEMRNTNSALSPRFRDYPDPAPTTTSSTSTTTTTVPEPTTVARHPAPVAASRSRGAPNWEALRQCEAGGDYSTNTGNGYFGAYQFNLGTWHGLGYEGLPSDAPPSTQDEAAQRLYEARGANPWPVCGARL